MAISTIQGQIVTIINELARLQTYPAPNQDKDDDIPFPRMISVGNGRSIIVSRKIDVAIVAVADELMSADPSLVPRFNEFARDSSSPDSQFLIR